MLKCSLSEVAACTSGHLHGASVLVQDVCIDSRRVGAGELFIALKGEHHDGHDHVAAAAAAGAAAALVSRPLDVALPQVLVADTLHALGDLARMVRENSQARVIGITGSNGKTTVKTLTAAILARHGTTHVTAGNYNNEIGLPLTVLALSKCARYAVLEMGAGKPHDIDYLTSIARPDVGLVNNVAAAHLERMGSVQGVAETKGAIYTALPADGIAIINDDDAFSDYFDGLVGQRRSLRFGWGEHNDIHADQLDMDARGSRFRLHVPGEVLDIAMPLIGRHNVANAMAAVAIAVALEVPASDIAAALQEVAPVGGRLNMRRMPGDWWLIDDSYNANPGSAAAAIDTLMLHRGEHWLVLGDMAELGPRARELHATLGAGARVAGVERLFAVGPLAMAAAESFGDGAEHFDNREALAEALRGQVHAGVVCLVKGSRSAAMDQVVAALTGEGAHHVA